VTAPGLDARTAVALGLGATLAALAFADGAYAPLAVGAGTAAVGILLVLGALAGPLVRLPLGRELAAAGACLAALLIVTALSLDWASGDDAGFVDVVRLAGYLGVFLLAGLGARADRAAPVLVAVAVAGVLVALVALGSRLLGLGDGDFDLVALIPTASGRLSYPLGYWNGLGALMALTLPPLAWIASEARGRWCRSVALSCFAPTLLVVYMTSSRGALIAILVGLAVAVRFGAVGRRTAAAAIVGAGGALPAIAAVTATPGILNSPGTGAPGSSELLVGAVLVVSVATIALVGDSVASTLSRARLLALRVHRRETLAAVAVAVIAVIAISGPLALIGDFRSTAAQNEVRTEGATGIVSTSGSGRAQFWETALDAFASAPVQGIGAGSYEYYWNQNGSLLTPARNAHSEPLEALAELGLIGFACLVGFLALVAVAGGRRAREPSGSLAGAFLGLFAAGMVGVAIDWTWQVPAVAVPILIAAGMLTGAASADPVVGSGGPGRKSKLRGGPPLLAGPALGLALLALALPSIWAGGVLAIASSKLEESADAFARGQLEEAAAAARTAAAVEPWAAEPWLRLALIEQAGDNYRAALRDVTVAIRKSPEDPRAWVLATALQGALGNQAAGFAYGQRTARLVPD